MDGKGPRHERETIISFNDADDDAWIWTASETLYNRMKKRGWWPSVDDERHAEFVVPKKSVKIALNSSGKSRKPRGFAIRHKPPIEPPNDVEKE